MVTLDLPETNEVEVSVKKKTERVCSEVSFLFTLTLTLLFVPEAGVEPARPLLATGF